MSLALRNMTSLYLSRGEKMLLLYRIGSRVVAPSWCGIGGHFEKEELNDPRSCILREMEEEIGLKEEDITKLTLRYITLKRKGEEVRQNYYYFADLQNQTFLSSLPNCGEGILEWVDYDCLMEREMPFTAGYVIAHFCICGRFTDALYCGTAMPEGVIWQELKDF